jgi:hypothetical protein
MTEKTKKVRSKWEKGAKDPCLLKDISDTEDAFKYADAETARMFVLQRVRPKTINNRWLS